jgi:hypothetical protein
MTLSNLAAPSQSPLTGIDSPSAHDLKPEDTCDWLEDHGNLWNQAGTTILLEGVMPLARRQWNTTEYCGNAQTTPAGLCHWMAINKPF